MAGRSLRDWTSDLNVQLRDTSGSQSVYSFTEKYAALQEGFRQARGWFRVPDVYTSLSLVSGQHEYALPPYVKNLRMVERDNLTWLSPGASSSMIEWSAINQWWVVPSAQTNRLWIDNDYPGANVRIYYERDLPIPPAEVSMAGNMNATQGFIPVSNTSDFKRYQWDPPFYVILEGEVMRVEAVTATSFTGVSRGAFGTAPVANSLQYGIGAAHTSNVAVTPFIPMPDGGSVDQFINNVARQQLYLYRLNDQDSEGNRVVAGLATEMGKQAAEVKKQERPFHWPRTAQQKFPRRR